MERVAVVPHSIVDTFSSLKVSTPLLKNNRSGESYFPADFIRPLWDAYFYESDGLHNPLALPTLYSLVYQIILSIPSVKQLRSVLRHDYEFARGCGFYGPADSQPCYRRGASGGNLKQIGDKRLHYIFNIVVTQCKGALEDSLHNISDELDYKKISVEGLIPRVWVEYYRKPIPYSFDYEFEAVFANNTGVEVIDEVTLNIPLEWRSDIRQEAALQCLELGIEKLSKDDIVNIVSHVRKHSMSESMGKRYKEKSLFGKVFDGDKRELWEVIADNSIYNDPLVELELRDTLQIDPVKLAKVKCCPKCNSTNLLSCTEGMSCLQCGKTIWG